MSLPQDLVNVPAEDLLNANRAEDARRARRTILVKDHEGGDVSCIFLMPVKKLSPDFKTLPRLPYQVYLLDDAVEGSDMQVLDQFCAVMYHLLRNSSGFHEKIHFDVYQTPREDHLACVEHQRREIDWRNRNGIWPRLVSTWSADHDDGGDRGFIFVIDSADLVRHGISSVYFDPDEYHDPIKRRSVWHLAGYRGDFDLVRAIRIRTTPSLKRLLCKAERRAGIDHRGTNLRFTDGGSASRAERSAGMECLSPTTFRFTDVGSSSRALSPALEAASHDYAEYGEDEDEELLFLEQQNGVDAMADDISDDANLQPDGRPQIIDRFRCNELRTVPGPDAKGYGTETYEDSQSQCTVSVWDSTVSATRPPSSITLYCGSAATFSAESLFRCLNKGLISMEPWTLDVKRGFDSLSQAHVHQRREASRRNSSRVSHRRSCMRMLVRKIVAGTLPLELCDVIEEKLIFPVIPDYACSRIRPFHSLLLYLAPKSSVRSLSQGPLLVFSNLSRLLSASGVDNFIFSGAEGRPGLLTPDTEELRVKHLRFWHRVANEIHTIASLCAAMDYVSPQHEFIPSATISIDPPLWHSKRRSLDDSNLVTLRVDSPQTLTLHTHELFSHDLFFEALQLVDLTADHVLPQLPMEYHDRQTLRHDDSWSTSASLGLSNLHHDDSWPTSVSLGLSTRARIESRLRRLEVLEPGQSFQWPWICDQYLSARERRGELIDGHRYAFRANPNVPLKVVRWTYGKPGALERMCGRPPMPVSLEHEVTFTIRQNIDSSGDSQLCSVT
ncbi:hypothetical protein KC315_g4561 [Hortaea werneckii]|nr:hypothetical protein KC315_g4561 [Hortaea werneckii]